MLTFSLTDRPLNEFIELITSTHTQPFSVNYWREDAEDDSLSRITNISPLLHTCYVTHCLNPPDPRFKTLKLGVKTHPDQWVYTGEKKLLLVCFAPRTYQRVQIQEWTLDKGWVTFQYITEPEHYQILLKQHHFCLCPRGYSIDTYRFWECLEVGCIPVVDTDYYDYFPEIKGKYLKIKDFLVLTEEQLRVKLSNLNEFIVKI